MFIKRNLNSRDKAIDLVEDGMVSAEDMMKMCLQYMSTDDVDEMLDANELSEILIAGTRSIALSLLLRFLLINIFAPLF